MSGHSKWATTKHKKGIADAKRSKIFTKLQKEITVAVKSGDPNPDFNPRLRNVIIAAKAENMPKDKIDAAIKRASSSGNSENYEEMRYEGYANSGVAVIIEVLTDNKNRTASNIRSYFTKAGGSLGESGSVSFMFDRVGVIGYESSKVAEDKIMELALEAGADDVSSSDDWHEVVTSVENFTKVRDELIKELGDPNEAKITWKPQNTVVIDDVEKADKLLKFMEKVEDDDDVQNVIANFDIPDDVMAKLEQAQ